MAGARRLALGRQRQRGAGPEDREGRQAVDVLRRARARGARAGARRRTAASTSARRPTARSTRSRADGTSKIFFDPDDKYIWALAVDRSGQRLRRHRRQGRHLQDHAGRPGLAVLQDERRQRRLARVLQERRSRGRNRVARARLPHRRGRQGVRAARLAVPRDPRGPARRRRHHLRCRGERRSRAATAAPRIRQPTQEPARPPVPSVSTEITAISVVEAGVSWSRQPRRARARRAAARGAIYRIRPDGLWDTVWDSGDDAPYDLRDRAVGQPARRHRHRGQDLPRQRRSGARHAARARQRRNRSRRSSASHRDASSAPRATPGSSSRSPLRPPRRGTYESDVRDAGNVASWGVIRWRAVGQRRPGGGLHAHRQHRDAGRDVERVVDGLHERRTANRSRARTRDTSSGAPC